MQITDMLDLDGSEALAISAKHGTGVPEVLEAIVARIPPPEGDPDAPLKALVFDSFYDSYQGVVVYVRLTDGRVRPGTRILLMSNGRSYDVQQVGVFSPDMRPVEELSAGQVGYITASIKRVADAKVGETITETAAAHGQGVSRAIATPSRWCSPGSTRSRTPTTRRCATPSRSSASTIRRSTTSRRPRWRWATASAAGSSACCTWRSSRSGSSASSTSR